MEFYLPVLGHIVNEQRYSSSGGLLRWSTSGAKRQVPRWFHTNVPVDPPFRATSSFHPAVLLPNSLYEHPFLCKPVLAMYFLSYWLLVIGYWLLITGY